MRRGGAGGPLVPALALAGALAVTVAATGVSWEAMAPRRPLDLVVRGAGWLAVGVGAVAWLRGVRAGQARLLLALGVALFLRDLRESADPLVHDIGVTTAFVWTAVAAHLALTWPDGVLRGRGTRALVAACYASAAGTQLARVVDPDRGDVWPVTGSVCAGVLAVAVAAVVAHRWWARRDDERAGELVAVSVVVLGLVGSWAAFLNAGDNSSPPVDAVPVLVGLGVLPVAGVAYLRLRAQLRDVRASRRRAEEALAQVERSRRRLVEATEGERRRIQHDLHDGAQQGLAAVQLLLWEAQRAVPDAPGPELEATRAKLAAARGQLAEAIEELRALVQGIYPAVLQDHGLLPALEEVARRSPVPVVLDVPARRWPHELEITLYFCVKEVVANVLKHAQASRIDVSAQDDATAVVVRIEDDGLGVALPPWGGGLKMLQDRVETVGGRITDFRSVPGTGTSMTLLLPCPPAAAGVPALQEGR